MGNFKIGYYPTYYEEDEEEESRHYFGPWQTRRTRDIYNGTGVPGPSSTHHRYLEATTVAAVSQNQSQGTTSHPSTFVVNRPALLTSPGDNNNTASTSDLHSSNSWSSTANPQQPLSKGAGQILRTSQTTVEGTRGDRALEAVPRISPTSATATRDNHQYRGTLTASNSSFIPSDRHLRAAPSYPTWHLTPTPQDILSNSYIAKNVCLDRYDNGYTGQYPSFNYGYGKLSPVATQDHACSSASNLPNVISDGQDFLRELPTLAQLNSGNEPKTPSAADDGPMENDIPLVENQSDTPPQVDSFWPYMDGVKWATSVRNDGFSEKWGEHFETEENLTRAKDNADIDSYSMLDTPSASSREVFLPSDDGERHEQEAISLIGKSVIAEPPLATTAKNQPRIEAQPALRRLLRMRLDDGDLPAGVEAIQGLMDGLSPLPDELDRDNPEIARALEEFEDTQRRLENEFMRGSVQNWKRLREKFERSS